jgi:putative flippase GtrA
MGPNGGAAVGLLLLVLAVDAWVFLDARARAAGGRDVVARIGPFTLSTAGQWLLGCVVLWVFVVPLYLAARSAS